MRATVQLTGEISSVRGQEIEVAALRLRVGKHALVPGQIVSVVAQLGEEGVWEGVLLGSTSAARPAGLVDAQSEQAAASTHTATAMASVSAAPGGTQAATRSSAPAAGSRSSRFSGRGTPAPTPAPAAAGPVSGRPPFQFSKPEDSKVKM